MLFSWDFSLRLLSSRETPSSDFASLHDKGHHHKHHKKDIAERGMDEEVHRLLEESAKCKLEKNLNDALTKAKEAARAHPYSS